VRDSDLVETILDEVAEVLCERRSQPLIEAARRKRLVSSRVVGASEGRKRSAFARGEAEHERPDKWRELKLSLSLDHADSLGVVFECFRRKEVSEMTFNVT
jgi:hypothetical protein